MLMKSYISFKRFHTLWSTLMLIAIGNVATFANVTNHLTNERTINESVHRYHKAAKANADSKTFTVTFTYAQNQTDFPVKYIAAYNAETFEAPLLSGAERDEIVLPEGKYDFMVVFEKHNDDWYFYKEGSAVIIKEDMEVNSNMTVKFNALDATNNIKMVAQKPDGTVCKVPTYRYDENFNKIEVEPGNIAETLVFQTILHRDYGRIYNLSTNGGSSNFIPDSNSKIKHSSDEFLSFNVNNVSEKYLFQQLRFMPTVGNDTQSYLVTLRQKGSKGLCVATHNPLYEQ